MGRVNKRFTVTNEHGTVASVGKIDSGADVTLVRLDIGRRLGVDFGTSPPMAIGGVGAQRVVGFRVPVRLEVGESTADIDVAVPVGTLDAATGELATLPQRRNLIGHDFLQATRAKLDFSRPHGRAFVDGAAGVDEVELLEVTPEEERALRAWASRQARIGSGRYHRLRANGMARAKAATAPAGNGTGPRGERHRFNGR